MSAFHQIGSAALRLLPAETGHGLALRGLAGGFGPRERNDDFPILEQSTFGLRFANPVGVSAGFDKNAVAIAGVERLGGGFVEVGGVTPKPQAGNPRPRLFRLTEDRAAINAMAEMQDVSVKFGYIAARFRFWLMHVSLLSRL